MECLRDVEVDVPFFFKKIIIFMRGLCLQICLSNDPEYNTEFYIKLL